MVAALNEWVRDVVQPTAQARFGQRVVEIISMGSYSCRGMNGIPGARISEHAFGNAIDIAGFRLADGRDISIVRDWTRGDDQTRAFLQDVHMGACAHFTTVLGSGANIFHYNHIHVDLAMHGNSSTGLRRICKPLLRPYADAGSRRPTVCPRRRTSTRMSTFRRARVLREDALALRRRGSQQTTCSRQAATTLAARPRTGASGAHPGRLFQRRPEAAGADPVSDAARRRAGLCPRFRACGRARGQSPGLGSDLVNTPALSVGTLRQNWSRHSLSLFTHRILSRKRSPLSGPMLQRFPAVPAVLQDARICRSRDA